MSITRPQLAHISRLKAQEDNLSFFEPLLISTIVGIAIGALVAWTAQDWLTLAHSAPIGGITGFLCGNLYYDLRKFYCRRKAYKYLTTIAIPIEHYFRTQRSDKVSRISHIAILTIASIALGALIPLTTSNFLQALSYTLPIGAILGPTLGELLYRIKKHYYRYTHIPENRRIPQDAE